MTHPSPTSSPEAEHSDHQEEREGCDAGLDQALADTFPASDPIATPPSASCRRSASAPSGGAGLRQRNDGTARAR